MQEINSQHINFENYAKILNISLDEAKRLGKNALEYMLIFQRKEKRESQENLMKLYKNKDFLDFKRVQRKKVLNAIELVTIDNFYEMKTKATSILQNLEKKQNISMEENTKKKIIMDILKLKLVTTQ